jgi:hypothetical protein
MAKEDEPKGPCPANDYGSPSGEPLDPRILRISASPRGDSAGRSLTGLQSTTSLSPRSGESAASGDLADGCTLYGAASHGEPLTVLHESTRLSETLTLATINPNSRTR